MRLELSKTGRLLIEAQAEIAQLRKTLKSNENRISRDNEYILRLDTEIRLLREDIDKMKKGTLSNHKVKQLQTEN